MAEANGIVVEALLDDVLDPTIIRDAVDEAFTLVSASDADEHDDRVERELAALDREQSRIMAAIASGRQISGVLDARGRTPQRPRRPDAGRLRTELLALASEWRRVLVDDPTHARPIVSALLKGRVTFTPMPEPKRWQVRGEGTLAGLFSRVFAEGSTSPTGTNHILRREYRVEIIAA
jgi:hypothetical protein